LKKNILILAANPTNTDHLRLDKEVREIQNGLQAAKENFNIGQCGLWIFDESKT